MPYESTTFEKETSGLKDRAQSAFEQVKARGSDTLEDAADLVNRHPGKTVAVSLLVGGVLGALIVNALSREEEPEATWSQLQNIGQDTLEKLKEGAAEVLCSVRDFIDSAASKLS